MPTITVSDETYRRIAARAAALDVSIEEAIVAEPESAASPHPNGQTKTQEETNAEILARTQEERMRRFEEMTRYIETFAHRFPPGYHADDDRDSFYRDDEEVEK